MRNKNRNKNIYIDKTGDKVLMLFIETGVCVSLSQKEFKEYRKQYLKGGQDERDKLKKNKNGIRIL